MSTDEITGLREWIDAYVHAWNSNDPAEIGALFTDDAEYFTAPFDTPWRGRRGIVERAQQFTEWWMQHPQASGAENGA